VAAGVDWVQVRERDLDGAALLALVDSLSAAARDAAQRAGREVRILVNRRADVALASNADGVHLGFDALDVITVRSLLGTDALVGVSTHSAAEARAARAAGADYVHLAPVFPPISKAPSRPPWARRPWRQRPPALPRSWPRAVWMPETPRRCWPRVPRVWP